MSKGLYISLFIIISFVLIPSIKDVRAQEYIIRPAILFANNYKNDYSQDYINNYLKPGIISSLRSVQQFYASHLEEHTFNFDQDVLVVYSDKPSSLRDRNPLQAAADTIGNQFTRPGATNTASVFNELGGPNLLPRSQNIIYAIWIVGSEEAIQQGGGNYTMMNQFDLLSSATQLPGVTAGTNSVLAHELGHSFGLVFSAYAKAHPCSLISLEECRDNRPYTPPPNECLLSIMCSGGTFYPTAGFNNSTVNPERFKLYGSRFINPQRDPAPNPVANLPSVKITKILSVNPNPVRIDEILEIHGEGFGDEKGYVGFIPQSSGSLSFSTFHIEEWKDQLIKVRFDENWKENVPYDVTAFAKVRTTNNIEDELLEPLLIKTTAVSPLILTLNIAVTCGDNKPLPDIVVSLTQSGNRQPLQKAVTNESGSATITYTELENLNLPFDVRPDNTLQFGNPSPSNYSFLVPRSSGDFTKDVNFYFPGCEPARIAFPRDDNETPLILPSSSPSPESSFECDSEPKLGEFRCGNGQTCASVEYEYIPGVRRCYNDFYKDEGDCWQAKINSDGNHFHCDTICYNDMDCGPDQVCNPTTRICWRPPQATGETSQLTTGIPISGLPRLFNRVGQVYDEANKVVEENYQDLQAALTNTYRDIDNGLGDILPELQQNQPQTVEAPDEPEIPLAEETPPPLSVTRITINNQEIWSAELGNQPTILNLNQDSYYPIWVEYSDGSSRTSFLQFQKSYQIPPPSEIPEGFPASDELSVEELQPDFSLPGGVEIDLPFIGNQLTEPEPEETVCWQSGNGYAYCNECNEEGCNYNQYECHQYWQTGDYWDGCYNL